MRICVADIEADGLLDEATRIWCAVFKDLKTQEVFSFTTPETVMAFMSTCDVCIMHNGIGYDWPLLRKLYGYEYKGKKIDTLLMSRLQRPNRLIPKGARSPHSVEAWGLRFGRHKPEHEDWSRYSPEMLHRCKEDVEIQHLIYKALIDEGRTGNWSDANRLTHQLFTILEQQEDYGWLFDQTHGQNCLNTLTRWIDRIDRVLRERLPFVLQKPAKTKGIYNFTKKPFKMNGEYTANTLTWMEQGGLTGRSVAGPYSRIGWKRVDLGSNAQVKKFLLDLGWQPREWNYKEGARTSPKMKHDDPFEGVQGSMGRLIAKRVQCRHRRSQIEGWFRDMKEDGRVHQIISGIAATGRLTHRVIVNVPGDEAFYGSQMRKCFIAKDGFVIVGVDSAACQNRMLAARVGDPAFTKTLLEGNKQDKTTIHYVNQAAIKKIAKLEVSYKICKNLNYAFMFGAQDPKLGSTAGVSEQRGADIRKALLSVSPGLEKLINELTDEWRSTAERGMDKWGRPRYKNGTITGLDGRPVLIEKEHTLLVYMLQSDEAIMMQYALCFLYKWCEQRGWKHGREYGFVANVHDEYQAEVREDIAEEFAALGRKAITKAGAYLDIACPHVGESDIGKNWCETH